MTSNPWRGELIVEMSGRQITLRCRMDVLAKLLEELGCETFVALTKKWDGLSPEVLRATLRLLAESPSEADAFWPYVNGLEGLQLLHEKFYRLVSGLTPTEIAEDEDRRKKLQMLISQKTPAEIEMIATALKLS